MASNMAYCKIPKLGGPSEIHGSPGPIFYPVDKANIIVDCSENQFRVHDMTVTIDDL